MKIVKHYKLMTIIMLLPFFNPNDLAGFCLLNKACYQLLLNHVNFQVLIEAWGRNLTPADVIETRMSIFRAFQVAVKYMMIKSIHSQHIIPNNAVHLPKKIISAPEVQELTEKNLQELKDLTITQVSWGINIYTLGFTLSDGSKCKAGILYATEGFHTFDPAKKITKVEAFISQSENFINQINFFHHEERLVRMGMTDSVVKKEFGRREVFEIADDEQLIGCRLDEA